MKFSEIIDQACALLQRKGRLTYRSLKLEFALDDEYLDVLKGELIDGQRVAIDEGGKVLVWVGNKDKGKEIKDKGGNEKQGIEGEKEGVPKQWTPPHLAERIRATEITDGERKTITALFADLKGSTALIEGLDPEEARSIIDPALQLMMDAVHRYEGYVAQALGDGIFALFGAPIAHEDHPQRALFAALRMQDEMQRYSDQVRLKHGVPLAMRVGINTGEVVVRSIRKEDLHTDYVPVGHSTNLAARMEQMATPGSILITEYTRKLVEGYFELKALGAAEIKGVEAPLPVYEVLGAGALRTKLQVAVRRGLTRFVGRQGELEQLHKALEHTKAGRGQIVGVMSEPGLGKSRLFYEFKLLSQGGCLVLEAYSVSHGKATAYLPVIELLKSYFEIQAQDDERKRREKVTGKVLTLDRSLEDTLPYLFALLGIEEQPSPLQQMDPQIRRQRTFEALKKLFFRESLNQPLILLFEDLHWIDSETQGFLDTLSEGMASARILLLVNYRPEYRHEWGQKTYYTQLRLAPFGKAEAEEFLLALLGNATNLHPLKHFVLEKTEGTPFFMEEVVQTLAEEGVLAGEQGHYRLVNAPTELHISPTVQGVLAARIDRLSPAEKAFLHQLAVIGRQFPLSLVRKIVPQPEEELYHLLASLQSKEFLYEQPAFPESDYLFKHALTQEVAYSTVLQDKRKALHERTAQAIESLYSTKPEDHYSALAHHYTRSGKTEKAVEYLHLAGQQAAQRSAYAEAVTHLTTALELLNTLPDTREHAHQELTLHLTLGVPLLTTRGVSSPEVKATYTRALELCQQMGETPHLSSVLWGLWVFYLARAELQTARSFGQQLLDLARKAQNSALFVEAHFTLADTLFHLGDFVSALDHANQGFSCYDLQQHRTLAFIRGHDFAVVSECYGAWSLWTLGYPDQARKRMQDTLALAQEISHPLTLGIALAFAAYVYRYCGERQIARERAEMGITLCTEYGFPYWSTHGIVTRGWDLGKQGQQEEGISQIRESLALLQTTWVPLDRPYYLALLAEMHASMNEPEKGLRVVAEALAELHEEGERFEAELYRLRGELTLAKSKVQGPKSKIQAAEECFLKAIEIARQQQAKSLELRAVTSLARLWQQQGKTAEAHQMLAEIYGWFTEGFDTKDLQEAKALLGELR